MSFSSPYAFMEMGSDGAPVLDGTQFNEIMATYGFNVRRRRMSLKKDCPCYDPIGLQANPTCPFCEGTGSVSGYQDEIIRGFLLFNAPDGYWKFGNVRTKAGIMERVEAAGFFPGGTDVRIGDLILFTTSSAIALEEVYEELEIFNIQPRVVGTGAGHYVHIFTRADMRKTSYDIGKEFAP